MEHTQQTIKEKENALNSITYKRYLLIKNNCIYKKKMGL